MDLFPFQRRSRGLLLAGGGLCADEQGLGKTRTALSWMDMTAGQGPCLVVCPAVALGAWLGQGGEAGLTCRVARRPADVARADLTIVSIDMLRNPDLVRALLMVRWACVTLDEAHYAKNPAAARTQGVVALADELRERGGRLALLTGTPTPNHIGELWTLIRLTDHERIGGMTYDAFTERFCRWKFQNLPGGRRRRVIAGNNRLATPMLMDMLGGWWIRHRKADVLPDLPPKLRSVVPLEGCDLTLVDEMLDSPEGRAMRAALESGDLDAMEQDEDHHMARLRRLLALAKVEKAVAYVRDMQHAHPKLLVWGWHVDALHEVRDRLRALGTDVVYGDGSSSQAQREALVHRIQKDPRPVVGVLQIKAMGTAITLTAADRAVFLEASFTPTDNAQAEDRIHRIGQDRGVLIDYLAARGGLDEAVMGVIARKTKEWEAVEAHGLAAPPEQERTT